MSAQKPPVLSADELRVVSCAGCGLEMTGEIQWQDILDGLVVTSAILPPRIYVRVAGRPYCRACHDGRGRVECGATGGQGP